MDKFPLCPMCGDLVRLVFSGLELTVHPEIIVARCPVCNCRCHVQSGKVITTVARPLTPDDKPTLET